MTIESPTQTTETRVRYPDADDLDTGHLRSGDRLHLYLVPAEETEDGVPAVTRYHSIGSGGGTPEAAWLGRWASIASLPPAIVGESVLRALQSIEDELVAASEAYRGAEWDGSHLRGRWESEEPHGTCYALEDLESAWLSDDGASEDLLRSYWDAGDWYGPAGDGWPELAREADVDPESIVDARDQDEDWQEIVRDVARRVESWQDEAVRGTEEWLVDTAEEWLAGRVHCECGSVSGVRCEWYGDREDTVVVEWMPREIRASHEAAGSRGRHPHNGSRRLRLEADTCAPLIVETEGEDADGRPWAEIVDGDA